VAAWRSRALPIPPKRNTTLADIVEDEPTGVAEDHVLPANYNEAYHLIGDGVAVPVVRFLASHILEPILAQTFSLALEGATQ
jgi:hypothetical protein